MSAAFSSGTAAALVHTGPISFVGVQLCAGADAATAIVYDNTAGSGTIVAKVGAGAGLSASCMVPIPVACSHGLYVAVTGTTPQVNVYYR